MKVLLLGKSGQLGSDLLEAADPTIEIISPEREAFDFTRPETLRQAVEKVRPHVVINAVAFNDVVGCETKTAHAFLVNALAVQELAHTSRDVDSLFITVSTDYVFDGAKGRPYVEEDACRPLQAYGVSKLAGELLALATWERSVVVRTAGLYGKKGSKIKGGNFVEHRLKDALEKKPLSISADDTVSPTSTASLARAILQLAAAKDPRGIYHLVNEGACSWYEFTREIFRASHVATEVIPVHRQGEFGGIRRPQFSALENRRAKALGIELPDWKSALGEYIKARKERTGR